MHITEGKGCDRLKRKEDPKTQMETCNLSTRKDDISSMDSGRRAVRIAHCKAN